MVRTLLRSAAIILADFADGLHDLGHDEATITSFFNMYIPMMQLLSRIGDLMRATVAKAQQVQPLSTALGDEAALGSAPSRGRILLQACWVHTERTNNEQDLAYRRGGACCRNSGPRDEVWAE
jgi:hypothetical protein